MKFEEVVNINEAVTKNYYTFINGEQWASLYSLLKKQIKEKTLNISLPTSRVEDIDCYAKITDNKRLVELIHNACFSDNFDDKNKAVKEINGKYYHAMKIWILDNIYKYTLTRKPPIIKKDSDGNLLAEYKDPSNIYVKFALKNGIWTLVSFHNDDWNNKAKYKGDNRSFRFGKKN